MINCNVWTKVSIVSQKRRYKQESLQLPVAALGRSYVCRKVNSFQTLELEPTLVIKQTIFHRFTISFSSVLNQQQKNKPENSHSVVPTQVVQLTLSMIAIPTHHASSLLQDLPFHSGLVYDPSYNSQLASILSALKIM
ncbi:unnamed protein product [Clavelina lepadiformis]|uniref:Uncharacterized protein n=1 Tax=Clavelina lepadiformis TaxID=159417 RepID=A0ABP0FW41_CLALP